MPTPYADGPSRKICSLEPYVAICFLVGVCILAVALGLTYYNVPDTPAVNIDTLDNDLWITMNVDQMWENFKVRFNKSYGEEGEQKFEIFKANLRTYLEAGRRNPLALLSFTKFSDLNETAGELLNYTGLNSEIQLTQKTTQELLDARAQRDQNIPNSGTGPTNTARRGTALWDVLKKKPLSAFKTPQRHGHAFRVKNAIRRATKDPHSVTSSFGKNRKMSGPNSRQAQTLQDSAGADSIWITGFCTDSGNLDADGAYMKQGVLSNGRPYYRLQSATGPYTLFFDEQCDFGQTNPSQVKTWRLAKNVNLDTTRTKRVVDYDSNAAQCIVTGNVNLYKPDYRADTAKEPWVGRKYWFYRGACTSWAWQHRPMTFLLDTAAWSWMFEGKVTEIRSQGACGSCWAFAGIGAMESAWMIGAGGDGGHNAMDLSEQMFLDCEDDYNSCNGGYNPVAFMDTVEKNAARLGHASYGGGAVVIEANYGYRNNDGATNCRMNNNKMIGAVMNSLQRPLVGLMNEHGGADDDRAPKDSVIQVALQTGGPIFVAIFTNGHNGWFGYNGGILTDCSAAPYYSAPLDMYAGDHAVVLIGFGEDAGQKYWIIRNSWGREWGEGGYIRVARAANPPCIYTPYLYTAADEIECPIATEETGAAAITKGTILRRQRTIMSTCQALCCADLACEGFTYNVAGTAYYKDCILRTNINSATEAVPTGDTVDTLFILESDLRSDVNCEPVSFTNLIPALNGETFKGGFADQVIGGKSSYWSENFYMYWCRQAQSWHIAYRSTYSQNLEPGQCNAIARKADPSHFSAPGGWWFYNSAQSWWEKVSADLQVHCGGCNSFALSTGGVDAVLATTWTADYSKMQFDKPTFWSANGAYYLWANPGCAPNGWRLQASANYPPGASCSYYARTAQSSTGSFPYVSRRWLSGFSGRAEWWEEASAFDVVGTCQGNSVVNPTEYCESCEGRGLAPPGWVTGDTNPPPTS
eukprot:Hpha_TRINITY_DN16868_c3_g2::TRINITY_DN16868_c3_g2_i1::g.152736::m.152736